MAGVRHVWVRPEFVPIELPGLLLEWRNDEHGWRGLVSYAERDGRIVTQWLPAANLRPVKSSPRTGSAYG
ncbi:hypothetical protein ACFQ0K_17650 [Nocardioides caeni]|uniref:Uncharacterized protein n=1 Tax=Nocardioides caeni TaxID=574700 RepID=A0A4S8NC19_9ACTN|nr:hypothetical protein [Nocardioides caeni]THV13401.1 hypothetical protein E9934_10625 [Nocardioides caeni]